MKRNILITVSAVCFAAVIICGIPCQIKLLFGIPCPTCGMTRAWRLFFRGEIRAALYMHPLFLLPPAALAAVALQKSRRAKRIIAAVSVTLLLSVWIIRMAVIFPSRAPMDLNSGAPLIQLIERILKK